MEIWNIIFKEVGYVLQKYENNNEAFQYLSEVCRLNKNYQKNYSDPEEKKLELEIWDKIIRGELENDFQQLIKWTYELLSLVPKNTSFNTLCIELGDAPELFSGRAIAQDIKNYNFYLDQIIDDTEIIYFTEKGNHGTDELECYDEIWQDVCDFNFCLIWFGFSALAIKEACNSKVAFKKLQDKENLHLMAGFGGLTDYIGTLSQTGYSYDPKLKNKKM